jgi:hypothetical protein
MLTTRVLEIYKENLNHLMIRCKRKAAKIIELITVRSVDITMLSPTKVPVIKFYCCTVHSEIHIVHSTTNALLLNLERFKIYTIIHINIAPTCFGLRQNENSHSAQHTTQTPLQDMLPQHHVTYNFTECSNITLATLSTSSVMMVEDRNM